MNAPRSIRYLLFDLGGTLMHARQDWKPILEIADSALVKVLDENKIQLDAKSFRERLHGYYHQRDEDLMETTYHFVLQQLLTEVGYADVDESVIRCALDALYTVTQPNWQLVEGAYEVTRQLKASGYHLGILSNAGDDKDVQELIEGFGIRNSFDFVLTSAACFYRKPHERAFEIALAHWNISPEEAIMIGDNLIADISGAQNLKMNTIWIKRYAEYDKADLLRIHADLDLPNLDGVLFGLQNFPAPRR